MSEYGGIRIQQQPLQRQCFESSVASVCSIQQRPFCTYSTAAAATACRSIGCGSGDSDRLRIGSTQLVYCADAPTCPGHDTAIQRLDGLDVHYGSADPQKSSGLPTAYVAEHFGRRLNADRQFTDYSVNESACF